MPEESDLPVKISAARKRRTATVLALAFWCLTSHLPAYGQDPVVQQLERELEILANDFRDEVGFWPTKSSLESMLFCLSYYERPDRRSDSFEVCRQRAQGEVQWHKQQREESDMRLLTGRIEDWSGAPPSEELKQQYRDLMWKLRRTVDSRLIVVERNIRGRARVDDYPFHGELSAQRDEFFEKWKIENGYYQSERYRQKLAEEAADRERKLQQRHEELREWADTPEQDLVAWMTPEETEAFQNVEEPLLIHELAEKIEDRIENASVMQAANRVWMGYFIGVVPVLCLISFCSYGIDKSRALRKAWRIPEASLLFWDGLGGWIGGLIAQQKFRHKTKKVSYRIRYYLAIIVNVGVVIWLLQADDFNLFLGTVARGLGF